MKYTKDRNKAEDFCQNGFIKVHKNLHKYDDTGSLEGWVRRVIKNNILDELRKKDVPLVYGTENSFDFSRLDTGNEEEELESGISMSDIVKILPKIPQSQRITFEKYYLDGLTHIEIAEKLGVTPSTSKTNLMKAKKKIKSLLNREKIKTHSYLECVFLCL